MGSDFLVPNSQTKLVFKNTVWHSQKLLTNATLIFISWTEFLSTKNEQIFAVTNLYTGQGLALYGSIYEALFFLLNKKIKNKNKGYCTQWNVENKAEERNTIVWRIS